MDHIEQKICEIIDQNQEEINFRRCWASLAPARRSPWQM